MKIALVMLHGQANSSKNGQHQQLFDNICEYVDIDAQISAFPVLYWERIQGRQNNLMNKLPNLGKLRKLLISSVGDTASIFSDKETYDYVMQRVKYQYLKAGEFVGDDGIIIFISHSLGCYVASNFLWDMQKAGLKDSRIKRLFTTGNPTLIFLSGIDPVKAKPFSPPSPEFSWVNFWAKRDPISSPLQPFNIAYNNFVEDVHTSKGWFWWTAHSAYRKDKDVYKRIAEEINLLSS